MEFIGNYWFVWLICAIVLSGLAIFNQIRMFRNADDLNIDSVLNGFWFTATLIILAYISVGFLVVSIIVNLISYANM